jgi:hypothetical protein
MNRVIFEPEGPGLKSRTIGLPAPYRSGGCVAARRHPAHKRPVRQLRPVISQNLNPYVLMMQPTQNWYRCDGTELLP